MQSPLELSCLDQNGYHDSHSHGKRGQLDETIYTKLSKFHIQEMSAITRQSPLSPKRWLAAHFISLESPIQAIPALCSEFQCLNFHLFSVTSNEIG